VAASLNLISQCGGLQLGSPASACAAF